MNATENSTLRYAKEIAEFLVEKTQSIDLILAYGSLGRGTTDEFSDFDLLVVSESKRISWNFIWQNRPVSVWTLTWKEAEELVKGHRGVWSVGAALLTHNKILWSKSKESEKRLQALTDYLTEGSQAVLRKTVLGFNSIYGYLWRLQEAVKRNDSLSPAFLVWDIGNALVGILAALNGAPLINNWGRQQAELERFDLLPSDFISRYTKLVTSTPKDALIIASELVDDVYTLVSSWFQTQRVQKAEFIQQVEESWPGNLEYLNKIRRAVSLQDLVAGRYAAVDFAEFAIWFFHGLRERKTEIHRFDKPHELVGQLPPAYQIEIGALLQSQDLERLVEAAAKLTNQMQSEAIAAGATLPLAATLTEAKAFLKISNIP
ncbi:MAG: nucleotidyltransferase domain-containing protein [Promethearchaeota archaeon]